MCVAPSGQPSGWAPDHSTRLGNQYRMTCAGISYCMLKYIGVEGLS